MLQPALNLFDRICCVRAMLFVGLCLMANVDSLYALQEPPVEKSSQEQKEPAEELQQSSGESTLKKSPLENGEQKSGESGEAADKILAPWEEEKIDNSLPDLQGITPRDLLVGLDEGELEHLNDYNPIEPGDSTLIEILYRLQRFSKQDMATFTTRTMQTPLSALSESPADQRLQIFSIAGRAKKIVRVTMVERIAELYQIKGKDGEPQDFEAYYQVHVELEPLGTKAIICSTEVPRQWLTTNELDEPFAASAMFLKISSVKNSPLELIFATDRLQWFPDSTVIDKTLQGGPLLLSRYGFDVTLLDDARKRNRKSINSTDADCFYRMLAAANAAEENGTGDIKIPQFDLVKLMNNPSPHHGDIFMITADVRRVTRIEIDDPYHQNHLAFSHYYQLDGFVNTDSIIRDPNLEKHGLPDYGRRYPVSICVVSLPPGMEVNAKRVYQVTMPVFYFKTWTFRSQLSAGQDPKLRHVAPLLIGIQPKLETAPSHSSSFTVALLSTVCVFLFAFIWFGFWKQYRDGKLDNHRRFQVGNPEISVRDESENADTPESTGEPDDQESIACFPRLRT